ncbi:MAG: ATP-binding protein [Alphaproteobacteria bacterium]
MKANQYLRSYYADLVRSYIQHEEERFLSMASDLGRSALRREIPLEEVAEMHDAVLLDIAKSRPEFTVADVVRLASPPFLEMVMAYGMAFRDQLEQRRAVEAQLLQAKDAAEIASRAKSDFLASMSHELRTPLNAVIGFADIIAGEYFGPVGTDRYREDARNIGEAGRHLLDLISDILDVSKVGAGQMVLGEEEMNLIETVDSCVRMVRVRAENAGLRVEVAIEPALPLLRGDRRRVKQILLNLLSNAVKFTPSGGAVVVTVTLDEDDSVVIAVSDTGIGMAPEDIPRALTPFVQLDSGTARRFDGPGIGLALVKSLVELHEGVLVVESTVGNGTTATVRFPPARVIRPSYCI